MSLQPGASLTATECTAATHDRTRHLGSYNQNKAPLACGKKRLSASTTEEATSRMPECVR